MDDLISRQAAIATAISGRVRTLPTTEDGENWIRVNEVRDSLLSLPSAEPDEKRTEERTETHGVCLDAISRQAAIDAISSMFAPTPTQEDMVEDCLEIIENLPSVQQTLYGYNIEHLELIARVLQKEDLPPERIVEALTDIGRIVAIVVDEFEETLRRAVEQCTI